ncbi:hypothetical protein A3F07_01580 [candidate division WWE3 bacterium RIFCSPHIGHO2_12_FULL_38_15]|uniref:Uncharacterized protein n=1 Tax=candidate division WWE3 bacterium RIFCSPHIGHO2_02_FULL_38_14 TaxID=1802620 RepID=A0A1F4V8V3_UNCKA|nr:MAG: hypothetical protein A2793_01720 [candidate division WWE3 bacterium RIFCSPHIGHO2_01_FULL_38_45]OGC48396.1 MAG: hypothetical protein A3F07_01580 [candidate division WWE3 bacterium RIFCSPHIGHO2_12_FULL_38_15]OGC53681.1 MAG: hypothetical protein A3D91_04275 [candidate division WWE3 bacterium RIFCSPHIGHO2_02_FULL_38_14]OGC54369.1 MAG: hypothetical protein A3B64_02375 [candidate division WWE3 bacterium RIFCSPLOWO2_01_FULL_37_24]HLB51574.1 hypothetical protein [Patescibacteria group bacterium
MVNSKQKQTPQRNADKEQKFWKGMPPRMRALAEPSGKKRAKPGTKGEGDYFRIVVRPKGDFVFFRYHDVGTPGHIQRLTGKRSSGSWDTQAWLISKSDAHIENDKLVPDSENAKELLNNLGSVPKLLKGDIFSAKDRQNIPEKEKPTKTQQNAYRENIAKAQKARRKS